MTPDPSAARAEPDRAARRARGAVSALFLTNGALYANVVPRLPEIKDALGLSDTLYGASIAAMPVGALISGLAAASLIRRVGSGRLAAIGSVLLAVAMLGIGLAPLPILFALALFTAGLLDSVTDVAQNAHGLRVQRRYGRSIINGFHALWSLGAVVGGLMSAGAIALGLPLGIHLAITGLIFALTAVVASRFALPGPEEESGETDAPRPSAAAPGRLTPRVAFIMAGLAVIAIAGTIVEEVGSSWATLYMRESLGAAAVLAPMGFIALIGSQFIGRLVGDRLVDRFGQRMVAVAGGLLVAVGMGSALAVPTIPGTLIGFAAAGFGVATLVPAAMHAADELPGLRPGSGLTVVTWLMRLGFLISPLVIGAISDATELRVSLLIVPVSGVLVVLLSGFLERRRGRG
ncbi:MFS transporter [Microbacterium oryzae]|uniref:MFS transporter n=1 Tax=Microbacterium oryzae TaxID=743009 RepID=A0A6I6E4T0_9MICO|nr:MFS transporter [Microbacterium oryzae]QGU27450.1 MFS transporter [Microbacterium oryzae]